MGTPEGQGDLPTTALLNVAENPAHRFNRLRAATIAVIGSVALSPLIPAGTALASRGGDGYNAPVMQHLDPQVANPCADGAEVNMDLMGPPAVKAGRPIKFKFQSSDCPDSSVERPLHYVAVSNPSAAAVWTPATSRDGSIINHSFTAAFASPDSLPAQSPPQITLKAYDAKGDQVGTNTWELQYSATKPAINPVIDVEAPTSCHPNPQFELFVQDDPILVGRPEVDQDKFFAAAASLGATGVRMNIIYSQWKRQGNFRPWINAAKAAQSHNFKVLFTLMQTPKYDKTGAKELSYLHLNPKVARQFAKKAASATKNLPIALWETGNEPDYKTFQEKQSLKKYEAMDSAMKAGIHAVKPNAKVITGGLAPNALAIKWIKYLSKSPTVTGISVHPYNDWANHPDEVKQAIAGKADFYETEYGEPNSDPDQLSNDMRAVWQSYCAGSLLFTQYMVYNSYTVPFIKPNGWNTGAFNWSTNRPDTKQINDLKRNVPWATWPLTQPVAQAIQAYKNPGTTASPRGGAANTVGMSLLRGSGANTSDTILSRLRGD